MSAKYDLQTLNQIRQLTQVRACCEATGVMTVRMGQPLTDFPWTAFDRTRRDMISRIDDILERALNTEPPSIVFAYQPVMLRVKQCCENCLHQTARRNFSEFRCGAQLYLAAEQSAPKAGHRFLLEAGSITSRDE